MERNYKAIQNFDKYYIQLETYSNYKDAWIKHIFKDLNNKDLEFMSKYFAESWIEARRGIMNA
jgi:hypothetical protein